jgi:membrane protein
MKPLVVVMHVRAFALLLIDRFRHVRAQQAAASLAFTTLLSLVPLIAVSVGVMSKIKAFDAIGAALKGFLLDNLLPDKAGAVIAKYTLQFSAQANKLTAVSSLMLLVAAIVMLLTIDRAFNQIWQVARPRPLVQRLITYWVVLTAGPLLLGAAVAGLTQLVSASLGLVDEPGWVQSGAYGLVPLMLLPAFLTLLYFLVPNRRVRCTHAIIGGLAAGLGLVLMQRLFGLYLSKFGTYTLIYGAFAVVPVFLLWLYVCWVTILLGALIAALLPEYQAGYRTLNRFHGRRYYGGLMMLAELSRARGTGGARSLRVLANVSRIGIADAETTLYAMRAAGWVEKTENQQWILACDLDRLSLHAVFDRLALSLGDLPPPQNDDEAALAARLREAHGATGAALGSSVAALLAGEAVRQGEASPSPQRRG